MIMPIDIDKKSFTRDKRGYNSREVDEFLDLIVVDYEKVLNDNRSMAHKIKDLEKQLEEAQKSDNAVVDTLETAKKLMADISASAERRAELMIRDADLESQNLVLDAKATVRRINEEHLILKTKVERLRINLRQMLENELERLEKDEFGLLKDIDRSDIPDLDDSYENAVPSKVSESTKGKSASKKSKSDDSTVTDLKFATVADLSESLKKMSEDPQNITDTIILK